VLRTAGLILPALLIGCSSQQRPELVPASARLQMSGTGREVYTAPEDGMVYVYDKSTDHLLWSGQVLRGQTVIVDPKTDQITLNGAVVSNRAPIHGSHGIDVYYDPSRVERAPVTAGARVSAPTVTNGTDTTVATPGSVRVTPPPVTVTPSVTVTPAAESTPPNR
jgi:hypothetical protein